MISRRRFLELSGLGGAAAASNPLLAGQRGKSARRPSLPPSIASLKSRKSEATPITREERAARQERARQLMSENALDAIVLMEGTSLKYFTGIRWWGGERLFALVLPAKGARFMSAQPSKKAAPANRSPTRPTASNPDLRTWQEDENPYQLVAQGLKRSRHGHWQAWDGRNHPLRLFRRNRAKPRRKPQSPAPLLSPLAAA